MKTIKLILKGLLLYVTVFIFALFVSGIDSIVEQGYTLAWLLVLIVLILLCWVLISKEDYDIITLEKWFKSLDKNKEEFINKK